MSNQPVWQVTKVEASSDELARRLAAGWEPFAVTTMRGLSWQDSYVWLRRFAVPSGSDDVLAGIETERL